MRGVLFHNRWNNTASNYFVKRLNSERLHKTLAIGAISVYILLMTTVESFAASLRTDQGRVRGHNEDFITHWEPANSEEEAINGRLYIVADGVGGAEAGEVASSYATERTVHHYLANSEERDWGRRLGAAMQSANLDLRQLVVGQDGNGRMATTMVAAVAHDGNEATIANVGDSRGYLLRHGRLQQITKDHSLVARLLEEGAITPEEALNHRHKNVILHSLGAENTPPIDTFHLLLQPGDHLVLCSDGLTRHVSDEEIAEIVLAEMPEQATQTLIDLANKRGGEDNISVAVLRFKTLLDGQGNVKAAAGRPANRQQKTRQATGRRLLWLYTFFLSIVQTIAIFALWIVLRI
jgi:PPM family protein phosphatase